MNEMKKKKWKTTSFATISIKFLQIHTLNRSLSYHNHQKHQHQHYQKQVFDIPMPDTETHEDYYKDKPKFEAPRSYIRYKKLTQEEEEFVYYDDEWTKLLSRLIST